MGNDKKYHNISGQYLGLGMSKKRIEIQNGANFKVKRNKQGHKQGQMRTKQQ